MRHEVLRLDLIGIHPGGCAPHRWPRRAGPRGQSRQVVTSPVQRVSAALPASRIGQGAAVTVLDGLLLGLHVVPRPPRLPARGGSGRRPGRDDVRPLAGPSAAAWGSRVIRSPTMPGRLQVGGAGPETLSARTRRTYPPFRTQRPLIGLVGAGLRGVGLGSVIAPSPGQPVRGVEGMTPGGDLVAQARPDNGIGMDLPTNPPPAFTRPPRRPLTPAGEQPGLAGASSPASWSGRSADPVVRRARSRPPRPAARAPGRSRLTPNRVSTSHLTPVPGRHLSARDRWGVGVRGARGARSGRASWHHRRHGRGP